MSPEDRTILNDVLRESANWVTEQVLMNEQQLVHWFRDQGIEVEEVDRAPFISVVEPALMDASMPFSNDMLLRLKALED
jgi:TRAP-type C4-dicarboxylate transport system substrate-binding protein